MKEKIKINIETDYTGTEKEMTVEELIAYLSENKIEKIIIKEDTEEITLHDIRIMLIKRLYKYLTDPKEVDIAIIEKTLELIKTLPDR